MTALCRDCSREFADGFQAQRVIGDWIDFYNTARPQSALAGPPPAEAYGTVRPSRDSRRGHFRSAGVADQPDS